MQSNQYKEITFGSKESDLFKTGDLLKEVQDI